MVPLGIHGGLVIDGREGPRPDVDVASLLHHGEFMKPHALDQHLDVAKRWLNELADNLELSPAASVRALHALRAGLHAIRDRLPASEVLDLGAQLPVVIRGIYYEGWTLRTDPRQIRTRAAMIARVAKELEPDQHLDPVDVLRAVIHLLVEHVTQGEINDVLTTLPKAIRALWSDLTGHAIPLPRVRPQVPGRRTGDSR